MWNWLARLKCRWWTGHLDVHEHDGLGRWLFCLRCGRRSPGWPTSTPGDVYMQSIAAGKREQRDETIGRDQYAEERRARVQHLNHDMRAMTVEEQRDLDRRLNSPVRIDERTLRQREALDRVKRGW